MRNIFLIVLLLAIIPAVAQNKIQFNSINQLGVLEGESGAAFQAQTVNGIRMGSFFTGVGVGIDDYDVRSIPLFLDVRKLWKAEGSTPFVYADMGMHFMWPKDKDPNLHYEHPGFYYDLGLGYKIALKENAILFNAGYSFKSYTVKRNDYDFWWGYNPAEHVSTLDYQLRRISIRVGFSF